jgi:hypothetical protein
VNIGTPGWCFGVGLTRCNIEPLDGSAKRN